MMKIKVLLVSLLYFFQTSLSFANDESYGSVYKFILSTKVSEFVFSRIAVVHSWFPGLLALTS